MFALPEAKRVRREDLNDSDASSTSENEDDIQAREALEAQIARALGIDVGVVVSQPSSTKPAPQTEKLDNEDVDMKDEEEEGAAPEEYDFALFGGSAAPTRTTKVILENEEESEGEGAILSNRPSSYYLAPKYSPEEKEKFAVAALTAEQIHALSTRRHWSDELPWKVTHITLPTSTGSKPATPATQEDETRRRPGKKRRLAIKVKERKKKEKDAEKMRKKEEMKQKVEDKEEHVKEKKKRLNRARKLKRREKAREERRARGEVVDDDEGDGSGSEGDE